MGEIIRETLAFRDGVLEGLLLWVVVITVFFGLLWVGGNIRQEILWAQTDSFAHPCTLISSNYNPSTEAAHPVTTINGKGGVGVGVVFTGRPAEHITAWDCGQFGRVATDDLKLFQQAKPQMTLQLKHLDGVTRIVGWM